MSGETGTALKRIASRPGWGQIKAVRTGRVYGDIDPDLLCQPGPRVIEALEALIEAIDNAQMQ
jgi:ABC-type Fe3+-hydroxamate transport system substrate-binding protein